ncbi:MAG: bi-domain-containing oxidoreductase [Alistipes sp.]|nr:bi-domain-containing oxidoreductase [Alistipes sp.]
MKQVFLNKGIVNTHDIQEPAVKNGYVLVHTAFSCISSGTELSGVIDSGTSLLKRALNKPKKVWDMLKIARTRGLKAMQNIIASVRGGNFGHPMGYSAAGYVLESQAKNSQYQKGDKVAIVGTGYANHAEINSVPENLVIKIPDNVSLQDASTAAIGGIAMQGVRQLNASVGDTVVVMGLGLIGQITVQILIAQGCRVIGVDINPQRLQNVKNAYHIHTINGNDDMLLHKIAILTHNEGADGAIFTAATHSSIPMSNCFKMLRRKGTFVLVGVSGMTINRDDIYKKELTFKIATSYGPGRYDPEYEEGGNDYPAHIVRWTEQRNIYSYLELLAQNKISLAHLSTAVYDVDDANVAFEKLQASNPPLLSIIQYPEQWTKHVESVQATQNYSNKNILRIGFIGTGSYVSGMHLPNISTLPQMYKVEALMNRSAVPAAILAKQYNTTYYTTNSNRLLSDPQIDIVAICTRHDTHAQYAIQALQSGKHVFVEKPAALNAEELNALISEIDNSKRNFLVGYNRRFSKYAKAIKQIIQNKPEPIVIDYTMNAGYVPYDSWIQNEIGGGRIIGEGCHIIDLFIYLLGTDVETVSVTPIRFNQGFYNSSDNVCCCIKFKNGSIATLNYISIGGKTLQKESMRVICDDCVIELEDYQTLKINGKIKSSLNSVQPDKGQVEILKALYNSTIKNNYYPISLEEIKTTSNITFEIANKIKNML